MSDLTHYFTSFVAVSAISLTILTTACAEKNNAKNTPSQLDNLNKNFANINFSGAYLASRAARLYYDFDAAQENSENSFVLTSMDNGYLADQAIRLSLISQDFDTSVSLARRYMKKLNLDGQDLPNNQKSKHANLVGAFPILTILIDHLKNNNPQEARDVFEKLKQNLNKPMRALIGGTIYRFNKEFKKAKLIEADLNGFALFDMMRSYHRANALYIEKKPKKALELFKKSSTYLDPLAVRSVLSAVQIHLDRNEPKQALELLKKNQKKQPDNLLWSLAKSFEKGEKIKFDLPSNYLQILGEDLYSIGILYARQHDYESAIAFFRTAQITGISHPYLLSALAETYALIQNYKMSAQLYLSIAKNEQFLISRESISGAAFTLNAAKKYKEADKLLKDAIAKDPKHFRYYFILADLLRDREEYSQAITYFTKALDLLKDNPTKLKWKVLYGRGIAYEQTKQWEKAEQDFLTALKLAPNSPELVNYLAYSWVDRNINLDKALKMLQHAADIRPNSGHIIDSLGWAYFRTQKYTEALPILEKAIKLMPADPVVNDHLGDVYWKIGRKREAVFQWQHALAFKPTQKDKTRIEAKIAVGYNKADSYILQKKNVTHNHVNSKGNKKDSFFKIIKSFFNDSSKDTQK